jgi:hypothetical protein
VRPPDRPVSWIVVTDLALVVLRPLRAGGTWLWARAAGSRRRPGVERIAPRDVGLDRFPPGGAFVQFSQPQSLQSRIALNRLARAVAAHAPAVVIVELPAARAGATTAPVVLYVDAGGVARRRWTGPPDRAELAALLGDAPLGAASAPAAPPAYERAGSLG